MPDWIVQQWVLGFAGGLVIGSAAALYLLANGRIMGASSILGGLVDGTGRSTASERLLFLAGLVLAPALLRAASGGTGGTNLSGNLVLVAAAGLLVGLGTRIAGGCTSGHGICGISRLSPRGLAATLLYMLAAAVTLAVFRHLLGIA